MSRNNKSRLTALTLLFIIIASTLGVMVLAQPEGSGNIHGTVLDEKGDPFSGVKVMAYSSSGGLFATKYTDSDGYFRFALYKDRYTIKFEKYGYVTEQYTIDVPAGYYFDDDSDPVKMGDIVMQKNFRLTTSILSRVVFSGETVSFPFTVSITGGEPEEIEFHVSSPEGWDTRVIDSSSEIRRALLRSGSLSLTLEVLVPETASEAGNILLTVMGSTNVTLEFTVEPQMINQYNIELSSKYTYISAELGGAVSYPLTVSNEGEKDETIYLQGVAPEGWTICYFTSSQIEILSLSLRSGESEALTIHVDPPDNTSKGEYLLEIKAVSGEGEIRDTLDLILSLRESEGEVELISSFTDVTVKAGSVLKYPLTIWNKGDRDYLFIIKIVSAPIDWDVIFKSGDIEVSSLLISAGDVARVDFEVTPSSDYESGRYNVIVGVESENGNLNDTLILGVTLKETSSEVEIISTFTDVTVKAGNTIEYPLRILNHGGSDITLRLSVVSAPSNWDTTFVSDNVETSSFFIGQGESQSVKLVVVPPRTVETGAYSMIIWAESDDGSISETMELKATVSGSYVMELEISTLYTTTTIGKAIEFTAKISNNGNSPLTSIYLDIAVPDDWDITTTPSQVSTLAPKESTTFTLVIETPANTVAGDYLITVQAISDQIESDETDLRVTAKASTTWGYIGLGLAGVVIIGMFLAFTRFKRR